MKKIIFIVLISLSAVAALSAEEAVLLDFGLLTADDGKTNNSATTIDVSKYTTYDLSEQNRPELKTSLAIEKWDVELAPSARFAVNENRSMVRQVVSTTAEGEQNVMGIRLLFPRTQNNSYAEISPEFEIPLWAEKDGSYMFQNNGLGVVTNVGVLKKMRIRVCGRNYTHRVHVVVETGKDQTKVIDFGALNFVGWRTLEWVNPHYIQSPSDRDWVNDPIYPGNMPYVKILSIRIIKDKKYMGGDFITYIDRIDIDYDKAYIETEFDIDDEDVWGIQKEWQDQVEQNDYRNIGQKQTKVFLEGQKLDVEPEGDDTAAPATTPTP